MMLQCAIIVNACGADVLNLLAVLDDDCLL